MYRQHAAASVKQRQEQRQQSTNGGDSACNDCSGVMAHDASVEVKVSRRASSSASSQRHQQMQPERNDSQCSTVTNATVLQPVAPQDSVVEDEETGLSGPPVVPAPKGPTLRVMSEGVCLDCSSSTASSVVTPGTDSSGSSSTTTFGNRCCGSMAQGRLGSDCCDTDQQEQQSPAACEHSSWRRNWLQRLKAACKAQAAPSAIGLIAALYNFATIYSARFTSAYIVQLVFLFAPIVIAIGSSRLLKQPTPPGLFITLFVTIGGSAMVVAGKWLEGGQGASPISSRQSVTDMIIGLALSLAGVLLMAAYMLLVQVSRHLTTSEQILMANRNFSLLLFIPLAFGVEGTDWRWLYTLHPADWGVLLFSVLFIYTLNNLWLQTCTRRIGANMFSVFHFIAAGG